MKGASVVRRFFAEFRGGLGDTFGACAVGRETPRGRSPTWNVLHDARRALGPHHRYTWSIRHQLAEWRGGAGDVVGAVTEYERLLADRRRIQGPLSGAYLRRWR